MTENCNIHLQQPMAQPPFSSHAQTEKFAEAPDRVELGPVDEFAGIGPRLFEVTLRESNTEVVSPTLYLCDVIHEAHRHNAFIASVAQERITPIANISGFAGLLLHEEFKEADPRELLDTIHQQSELMVTLIDRLVERFGTARNDIRPPREHLRTVMNVQHECQEKYA